MGWKKVKDLAVVVGSYTKDGEQKNRYENVGQVLQGDDGRTMMMLKRSFNPAGVPFREGGDMIVINEFEPREQGQQQSAAKSPPAEGPRGGGPGGGREQSSAPVDIDDSQIPF